VKRLWVVVGATMVLSSVGLGAAAAGVTQAPEPPLEPTPGVSDCRPEDRPETGLQGRVSVEDHASGRAAEGFSCNIDAIGTFGLPTGSQGTFGGYKVKRYVDAAGRECAYYDSTLLFPLDVTDLLDTDGGVGVSVLDMSDPMNPVRTAMLTSPAMLSPHESLVLSQERGLLAAVLGNPATNLGQIDVYDVSEDCREPRLLSTTPLGIFGHESGFAPDGRTFYSASPVSQTIVAVDLDDPTLPKVLTVYEIDSHGLQISDDGNRAYVAATFNGLIILDTSEVQARVPNPEIREVSRFDWTSRSIPQNAIPVTIDGHPYVVEVDEFGGGSEVGAARIIDVGDETQPRVVSNLRLEVHQPEHFDALRGDPGARNPIQGYAAHYCNVPQRDDPGIVACSMIISGLRVFDIRDPLAPREIAYFNAPVAEATVELPGIGAFVGGSNYAMSSPAFAPERGEIWYSDGYQGFYVLRVDDAVWPFTAEPAEPAEPAEAPVPPATEVPPPVAAPRSPVQSPAQLPATGGSVPAVFLLTAAVGAVVLLAGLRGAPARP
jgi:hypothetical protein